MNHPNNDYNFFRFPPNTQQDDSRLAALEKRADSLTTTYYVQVIKIHDLTEENHKLKTYIHSLRAHCETTQSQKTELEKKVEDCESKCTILECEARGKDDEIQKLRDEVKKLQEENAAACLDSQSKSFFHAGAHPGHEPVLMMEAEQLQIHLLSTSPDIPPFNFTPSPPNLTPLVIEDTIQHSDIESFVPEAIREEIVEQDENIDDQMKEFRDAIKFCRENFYSEELMDYDLSSYLFNPDGKKMIPQLVLDLETGTHSDFYKTVNKDVMNCSKWEDLSSTVQRNWRNKLKKTKEMQKKQEKAGMIKVQKQQQIKTRTLRRRKN
ncbi:hypothetical protein GCK72_007050 [Caenorhabditis remanei]|uniref:Uncharacterized protein n=1 Tax=Caenorhabditis remanei TaxID=31234 RepID=A0A6A5HMR4_CAERE|nr:hypothetical protein GCK72_007050 [Caenorhabditis remanei]KAF1767092.1 hypothetical protein GCK72_007050 [Caenorhabditis remanei]